MTWNSGSFLNANMSSPVFTEERPVKLQGWRLKGRERRRSKNHIKLQACRIANTPGSHRRSSGTMAIYVHGEKPK